jgi:hypothetical protein
LALYEEKHTKILLVDDEPDILEIVGYNWRGTKNAQRHRQLLLGQ